MNRSLTHTAWPGATVLAMNYGRQLSIGTPGRVLSAPEVRAAYLGT